MRRLVSSAVLWAIVLLLPLGCEGGGVSRPETLIE